MTEFFIAIMIIYISGEPTPGLMFNAFATHSECSSAMRRAEASFAEVSKEGDEIRLSCVSSESIGQNTI